MDIEKTQSDGKGSLKISGAMTIYEASDLRDQLLACLNEYDAIVLDMQGVQDCDTAGIQLLCAAQKSAQQMGKSFSLLGPAAKVVEAARNAGLDLENAIFSKAA